MNGRIAVRGVSFGGGTATLVRRMIAGAICLTATLGFVSDSHAVFSVFYDAGTTNTTTALTGFGTSGHQMGGMQIRTTWMDATFETATWVALGAPAGNAVGTGWSLFESGDTFGSWWSLANTSGRAIKSVLIDAGPGDTVYDTTALGDITGTAGSARGWSFTVTGGSDAGLAIDATYMDLVALTASAPVGDLFRRLEIDFSPGGGFASGRTLTYITDTDNLRFAGDLTPVPEPGTLGLLGLGLVGIAMGLKRRRA